MITIQRKRGTRTVLNSYTGPQGEVLVDTTNWVVVVQDGTTEGGWAMSRYDHTHSLATDSTNGFMSAADKTKLDGLMAVSGLEYQTVQAAGSDMPQEEILNFESDFTLADDSAGTRTTIQLSATGVGTGTYTKISTDAKGRILTGTILSVGDIPSLPASQIGNLATIVQAYPLSSFAVPTGNINMNGFSIVNMEDPISAQDAATKNYVDNIAVGLYFKAGCVVATTANINLASPGSTIDTIAMVVGERVLVKNQTTASQNGIYVFNGASSAMSRSLDADTSNELPTGTFIYVEDGAVNGNTAWVLSTPGPITLGTTGLSFVQFSAGITYTAGNGISIIGTSIAALAGSTNTILVGSDGINLKTNGVTTGTYNTVTVDAYGRVSSGSNTTYQATSANLTALAALSATGIVVYTGSNTFASRSVQAGAGITIANGDGVASNVTVSLTPSGVTAGTYSSVVVDTYGRVTGGSGGSSTAGGDLSGFYPNPTVATVGGSAASAIHSAVVEVGNATSSATASQLIIRDGSGRAQVVTPAASADIATKGYVDGLVGGSGAQTFTSSGTFTVPSNVSSVWLFMVGAGGGGGYVPTGFNGSGGGGGGQVVFGGPFPVTPSSSVTVTVGAGGAGGTSSSGGNGGNSSFAGLMTVLALGGLGGGPGAFSNGGSGGAGGGYLYWSGDNYYTVQPSLGGAPSTSGVPGAVFGHTTTGGGGAGGSGNGGGSGGGSGGGGGTGVPNGAIVGSGGPSPFSGAGGNSGCNGGPTAGANGNNYGGGGGGSANNGAGQNGGAGANGIVVVMW